MQKITNILAIESSCDETSAAIIQNGKVLSNHIATQHVHERYGGVVPELASRAHMQNIIPVVDAAIKDAGIVNEEITALAFTQAPGLIGSLLVGACFAKAFAQARNLPLIAVHHMQAHVLAHFIDEQPPFPFMCLTVSGGHTQIVLCKDYLNMEIMGETIDDAAGEAFDKVAKMLGLPYPGGPLVDKYAKLGDPLRFKFPLSEMPEYNFSFSGVKTSILYFLQKERKLDPDFAEKNLNDICASAQYTIVKMLINKLTKAAKAQNIKHVGIAGGVSANSGLRKALLEAGEKNGWKVYIPKFEYCTDNAAMIGITGYYKFLKGDFTDLSVSPSARATWG
ncbi:tRNA (adenosine(37)-N6)-threonylcarbamoyltransferase complex transferase subunit TsaD [Flavipsychrobacter stenotrophus]|uniref:tRNA N6-adenosine threonylcarbamoyltransferase n=1 Tax=Flavipsychrobacter stenotrophus TaxID=2077091 RepID=A0A2S7SSY9_9BACT|nr:tRNA (adenosine(37)-N6)-threonylcarbamoyltransferase complex transferase subunit TsaD [Flavipsychrobacter stenotrophus]PQJ10040.1 tRNA (adenosine(37)-N6)-threonylcarbamoyltransferase complex transferase subunit TsaD [Flavipsychrobacter stenotrophus]